MKCHYVEARDIPDAWFQLVDLCYKEGRDYLVGEGSYAGSEYRRELDYVTCHIKYPQTRPLLPEIPPGLGIPNPVPEGLDYIDRYLPYILTDHKEPGEDYTYGERLFGKTKLYKPAGFDAGYYEKLSPSQVEEAIAKLKRGFANNQVRLTIAQPSDIHLKDPPCWSVLDCRVFPKTKEARDDEEKLHFVIQFRSWDLYSGFPANLAAIAHLQEYMAAEIGIEPGEFICSSKGLHIYSHAWELAKIRLGEK